MLKKLFSFFKSKKPIYPIATEIVNTFVDEINLTQYNNSYNIYVDSIEGNDNNFGNKKYPIKTINRAIDILTETKLSTDYDSIIINLAKGYYDVAKTLEITPKHTVIPVIIKGDGEKESIISASYNFTGGWTYIINGIYKLNIGKNLDFRTFYVNDKLKVRARFPNLTNNPKDCVLKSIWNNKSQTFTVDTAVTNAIGNNVDNYNFEDLEIFIMEKWTQSIAKTINATETKKGVEFTFTNENRKLFFKERSTKMKNPNVWIENDLSLLDAENEWYYDKNSGDIYYKPNKYEDINKLTVSVPKLENIVTINGKKENKVKGVRFENLTIQYSNWTYPTQNGMAEVQATTYFVIDNDKQKWISPPAGIEINYADNVEFLGCNLRNFSGTGIKITGESNNFKFKCNNLSSVGGSALIFGNYENDFDNFDIETTPMEAKNLQKGIYIEDNFIHEIGRLYMGGIGIQGGYAIDVLIQHNEIFNGGYSGISLGWGWTNPPTAKLNHNIKNNRIHNTVNNLLFDGAEIYLLGRFKQDSPISEVTGNYINCGGGLAGLYFDEGCNNFVANNNVIAGSGKVGYLQMHDMDYLLNNITVTKNFITNDNYNVNSWTNKGFKKTNINTRDIIITENYLENLENWSKPALNVINTAGIRDKYKSFVKNKD